MATSLVKVDGTEVSTEASGKTVVNINICQESSLAYLVKAVAAAGQKWPGKKAPAPQTPEPSGPAPSHGKTQCRGEQKVLGGVQILLGITFLGLGAVLCLLNDYLQEIVTGAPFWMGSLFIVSGSLCVLSERRGGCFWLLLATFFNLTSVVAVCVGLARGVADLPYLRGGDYWTDRICRPEDNYGYGYQAWKPTPRYDWRLEECRRRVTYLLNMASGVQILLLIFSVAGLGIALFCLGYSLHTFFCRPRADPEGYATIGDPEVACPEVPPPYEEPAKGNTAA